ncbi:MAG: hypothetical protein Q9176_001709 [Flavoplaca citrina]
MKRKSYTVAVTGFGPYREYTYNNASLIRSGLPSIIITSSNNPQNPPIHILKYPHDINCIYSELLSLTPQLWNGQRSVYEPGSKSTKHVELDVMIHIGMHPDDSEEWFLEKRARRGKYEFAGDDGRCLSKGEAVKGGKEVLSVGFDVEGLAAKVRGKLESDEDPDTKITISNDAGLYFCELISYLSLSILSERHDFGRVIFLHVPKTRTDESVQKGIKVTKALIEACVESLPGSYGTMV